MLKEKRLYVTNQHMSQKVRNVCFTLNNFTEDEYRRILGCGYKYIVVGKEVGESGTPHLQGYIEFQNSRSFNALKKLMPRAHLEKRRGTALQASDYCKKDKNYYEDGEISKQGTRGDLQDISDSILKGELKVETIRKTDSELYTKYGRTFKELEDDYMRDIWRTEMTEGLWYFGKTGVGKTHKALDGLTPKNCYYKPKDNSNWWDGYRQQENVVMNEFRGEIPFGTLLELVDKWPAYVNRRGREPMSFISKRVIITSSLPPEKIYKNVCNEEESIAQLYRRFKVYQITPDGVVEHKYSEGNTRTSEPNYYEKLMTNE